MSIDIRETRDTDKFPEIVSQGLHKLEEIVKLPSTPQLHKVEQQIIDENIFNLIESKHIGPIEELILVRTIAQHLSQVVDPGDRNILFIALFPVISREPQNSVKLRILTSLVSLAVATHNIAVLDATAVWMQQVSCFSVRCSRVCQGLIQDYFQKSAQAPPHFIKALEALPEATPLFTANLITSLAQIFSKVGSREKCDEPPEYLVEVIVYWLRSHPVLILTPLTTSLPGISLPMVALLPIAPLAKWCIESPFLCLSERSSLLYSELHLLLLQNLQRVSSVRPKMTQQEVICADHMKSIAESLYTRLNETDKATDFAAKDIALNRLAQIILVALHTESLSGRLAEMWTSMRKLPSESRLMKTLLDFGSTQ